MCFHIHFDFEEKQIASEPIKCFKIVFLTENNIDCESIFKKHLYQYGKNNPTFKLIDVKKSTFSVHEGYHSFSNIQKARQEFVRYENFNNEKKTLAIVNCTIPKGSEYYHNPDKEEYVSSNLIVEDWTQRQLTYQ